MTDVTVEYPETRELIGGEVCPRGTMARLAALEQRLDIIIALGDDYDGYATVERLKSLIDAMVQEARGES